jgi:hypothetical protein
MRRSFAILALAGTTLASASWFPASEIDNPTGPGATEPNFSVAANGDVWMSWLERADSAMALKVASFNGKNWSAVRTVRTGSDFFVNWADFPSVQVLDGRRLAVHWLQRAGTGTYAYHVKVAFSNDAGMTWTNGVTAHTDTSAGEHGFVTMWREGNRLGAAWLDGRKYAKTQAPGHGGHAASNEMMVLSTTFDARGRRGPEAVLDARSCDCCQNSAAMTAKGPIVAYRDRSPDEIRDIYVARRVSGRWLEGQPVHRDNWKIAACPVNGPAVAAEGTRAVVAWFTAARDSAKVLVAFSNNSGETFSVPARLDNGAPGGRVDTELLRDGSALVSWIERTGGDTAAVRVRRVSADGRAGNAVTIATSSAARASGFPRMAVSGDHALFAWTVPGRPSSIKLARRPLSDFR